MKKDFRAIALGLMGLALFSCEDNNNPMNNGLDTPETGQEKTFTLSAKMGEVSLLPLANNTNPEVSDDDLRATLNFNEGSKWVTTSYKWDEFGVGANKINARWGALLGSNLQTDAKNCTKCYEKEPATDATFVQNSIWFNIGKNNTIAGQKLMMYCKTGEAFGTNVKKSWMCLGGSPGSGTERTRQYFKMGDDSNPNKLIKALKVGEQQDGREIPVMTAVAPYDHFQQKSNGEGPDAILAPRGSLIGIIINNELGRDIKVTDIIVNKASGLDFSGYFDWNKTALTVSEDAEFKVEYPNTTQTAFVFPVDQSGTNHIIKENETKPSIFYIWGFQNSSKKGEPLRLQIRYTSTYNGVPNTELTTRTFRVYPGKTKATATEFVDGKAYKTVLNLTSIQQKGGTAGNTDWSEGDNISEEATLNPLNPLALVAKYDIAKIANTQGINHELKFATSHKARANATNTNIEPDYTKFEVGKDIGLYTWAEAMRLFGYNVPDDALPLYDSTQDADADKWAKGAGFDALDQSQLNTRKYKTIAGQDYYIPNSNEFRAIIPNMIGRTTVLAIIDKNKTGYNKDLQLISFNNDWDHYLSSSTQKVRKIGKVAGKKGLQDVQIGNVVLRKTDYDDEYITKEVGTGSGNYVTYAIRFKGTKFESAWRYEYKKAELIGTNQTYNLVIKNVMLTKNSGKTLVGANNIATEEFFTVNNVTERIFSFSGFIFPRYNAQVSPMTKSAIQNLGSRGYAWTRTLYSWKTAAHLHCFPEYAHLGSNHLNYGFNLRPFVKN